MLLGHSELCVTMDFYAHLQKQTAAKAAQRMDAIVGDAMSLPVESESVDVVISNGVLNLTPDKDRPSPRSSGLSSREVSSCMETLSSRASCRSLFGTISICGSDHEVKRRPFAR